MTKHVVTFIAGDGVGPEVTNAARRIIEAVGVDIEWEECLAGAVVFKQGLASGVPEETNDPAVDRALGFLAGIPDAPVADHVDIYAAVHDSLLGALDAEPGLPPAAPRETSPNPEGTS